MTDNQQISYVAGIVGDDPRDRETRSGTFLVLRLAVTIGYPKDGEQYGGTEWYDVVVKHPGLQAAVRNEVYRGARIVVQGNVSTKEYNGKTQYTIWADRIGLIEYLRRDQVATPAAVAPAPADELGF